MMSRNGRTRPAASPLSPRRIDHLKADGEMIDIDTETAARLINGASAHMAQWIANAEKPEAVSKVAVKGFRAMLDGLRKRGMETSAPAVKPHGFAG